MIKNSISDNPAMIYAEAHSAGMAAGHGCTPTPMVVGTPTTPLGDDIDYSHGLTLSPLGESSLIG